MQPKPIDFILAALIVLSLPVMLIIMFLTF